MRGLCVVVHYVVAGQAFLRTGAGIRGGRKDIRNDGEETPDKKKTSSSLHAVYTLRYPACDGIATHVSRQDARYQRP